MGLGPRDTMNEGFSDETILDVWIKGQIIEGYKPSEYRLDVCGAIIRRNMYGDTTKDGNGWEIDHIKPEAKGGSDHIDNLQPLQWQNNRKKGDDYPISPTSYRKVSMK